MGSSQTWGKVGIIWEIDEIETVQRGIYRLHALHVPSHNNFAANDGFKELPAIL